MSCSSAWAQFHNQHLTNTSVVEEAQYRQSFLGMDTFSFLKNSEYFGPFVKGHTLAGHQIHPYLRLYPTSYLCVSLGVFTRRDWADTQFFSKAEPTFTLKYENKNLSFLLGAIEGGTYHRLIAPLYDWKRMLLRGPEPGLQLRYNGSRMFIDAWLDWLTLLNKPNNTPEELVAGMSLDPILIESRQITLGAPIQAILYHLGGQGITTKDYSLLLGTLGGRLTIRMPKHQLLKRICLENYYVANQYIKDIARPFKYGQAFYGSLALKTAWLAITGRYWYGHKFASENLGTPLYQSIAMLDKQVQHQETIRQLFFLQLLYDYQLTDEIYFGIYLEPYYDFRNHLLEHDAGLYVIYRPYRRLTSLKQTGPELVGASR